MGVSENVGKTPLYPMVLLIIIPYYPVFKWLAIIGKINPTFSDKAMCFSRFYPEILPLIFSIIQASSEAMYCIGLKKKKDGTYRSTKLFVFRVGG